MVKESVIDTGNGNVVAKTGYIFISAGNYDTTTVRIKIPAANLGFATTASSKCWQGISTTTDNRKWQYSLDVLWL